MLLDKKEVKKKIDQNKNGMYRFVKNWEYPKNCKIINGQRFWEEDDIDYWISTYCMPDTDVAIERFYDHPDIIWDENDECPKILMNNRYSRIICDDITLRDDD
jgi:predicted DNA-binding transcriptional regulator AlpA